MISRKKITAWMLAGTMSVLMLTSGCGKKEVDYNMGDNPSGNGSSTEGGLAGRLGIPESCDVSINTGSSGLQSINLTDDEVGIPSSDGMSVGYYEQIQIDNAYKQQLVESFLDKGQGIYERDYEHRIKSEIEAEIESIKQDQANMAEQGYTDPWYDSYIAQLEEELQDAPDEYPAAGDYSGSDFIGMMDGREYSVSIYVNEEIDAPGMTANLMPMDEFQYRPYEGATNGYCYDGPLTKDFTENNYCQMTEEEACGVADEFLSRCGVTDMVQAETHVLEWDYYDGNSGEDIATEYDGYVIHYNRGINGTPAYQGQVYNVDNLNMDDAWINMPSETFCVYVDDNGVLEANWTILYTATGEEETNVDLMTWDEMLEAANENIPAYYEKYPTNYKKIDFNDVRLSYYPVVDEGKENSYKYIPVWVFSQYEEYVDSDESAYPRQLVILNAMDGTVIDLLEQAKSMGGYQEYEYGTVG